MSDLFPALPEALSPRLAWMRAHGIAVAAVAAVQPDKSVPATYEAVSGDLRRAGETIDQALAALAAKLGVRLWNEGAK